MLWLTKELRLYLHGMWEELELKWLCSGGGSGGEAIQRPAAACNARGNNRVIVECSVLMAMVGRNGRIPPACPVVPDSVQALQKNPSNRLQKLIRMHAKLPRVIWQSSGFAGTFCVLSEC